jgi:hypothetical protein
VISLDKKIQVVTFQKTGQPDLFWEIPRYSKHTPVYSVDIEVSYVGTKIEEDYDVWIVVYNDKKKRPKLKETNQGIKISELSDKLIEPSKLIVIGPENREEHEYWTSRGVRYFRPREHTFSLYHTLDRLLQDVKGPPIANPQSYKSKIQEKRDAV